MHVEEGENIRRFNNRIVDAVEHLGRKVSGDATYGNQARRRSLGTQHATALLIELVGHARQRLQFGAEDRGEDLIAEPGVHREHRPVCVGRPNVLRAIAVECSVINRVP